MIKPRIFWCIAMGSALLFIFRCILLLYSAESGVNRVQVVMFCPGKNCMYVWLYVFFGCTCACVCKCDGDVICVGHLNRCFGWW